MKKMIAICEAFRMPSTYPRWRRLTEIGEGMEVILIAPKYFEDHTWPEVRIFETTPVNDGNFRVIPINMKRTRFTRNGFLSFDLLRILMKEKPDFLYLIGYEVDNIIIQNYLTRFLWDKGCKKVCFTMRGLPLPLNIKGFYWRWLISKKFFDAICCHYPHAITVLRHQGQFNGPIYLQTQVGVDKKVHYFSEDRRKNAREKLGIKPEEFIFGMACRMEESKGIFDVLDALPERRDYRLMILGDGIHKNKFQTCVKEKGIENQVLCPGFIPMGEDVAEALCAMDVFIHYPKTTNYWIDTFPLAVVQAMACKLPVIGSDSGAIPYQIGNQDWIVPETNPIELKKKMLYCLDNREELLITREQSYQRVLKTFEIDHLTQTFSIVMDDIFNNRWVPEHQDQANFDFSKK